MRTFLFWYTKDLRVEDLPSLAEADAHADVIVPVYIWDDVYLEDEADNRKAFLVDSLFQLDDELRRLGSGLRFYRGETNECLKQLCEEYRATEVFCTESRDPATRQLQASASMMLEAHGIRVHASSANFLLDPDRVKTKSGTVYRVFTPYRNAVLANLVTTKRTALPQKLIQDVPRVNLPDYSSLETSPHRQTGGTSEAKRVWTKFQSDQLRKYQLSREMLCDEQGTSRLAAHLNFGTISVKEIVREIESITDPDCEAGKTTFLNELIWREFNSYIAHHFPRVLAGAFREDLSSLRWSGNKEQFDAWKAGMTGFPIVDAGMRQLEQTGWMHNRARMIIASFLVKDLLINWQEGEAHFMEWLTDGDQVQNNAGWQWSASTGVDAQPYFRIFNPLTQSKKFDPSGEYIRRYVPELKDRPTPQIHQVNIIDGSGYPKAIVDHSTQRERAPDMFKATATNFRN